MLQGLITALATPFTNNGDAIDWQSLQRLIEYQLNNGANGLVVLGSTAESLMLNHEEKIAIVKKAIEYTANKALIIVGVSQIATQDALLWVNELNHISGIDYLLTVTPPYIKATQNGLYEHFTQIAKASIRPIILYNVPSRTGCDLANTTILKLANNSNIVGLKDASSDIARCCYLIKYKNPKFKLFSGDDATALAFTLCGGDGAISVTSNVVPKIMSQMLNNALQGNKEKAIQLNNKILDLHDLLFVETNPIPVKWALCNLGIFSEPTLRSPLQTLHEMHHNTLAQALQIATLMGKC